jgi:hypothetical protein
MDTMIWSFACKGFLRRKSRFAASVLGFAMSVAVFTAVHAILKQSRESIGKVLTHTGTHFIAFKPRCCPPPYFDPDSNEGFFADGAPSQPLPMGLLSEIARLPTVAEAAPFLLFRILDGGGAVMIGGFEPGKTAVVSKTCCSSGDLADGRFLGPGDSLTALAEKSFAVSRNLRSGSILKIKGISFRIVGIVNPGIRPAKADLYMPVQDAERIIGRSASMPIKGLMNIVLVESSGAHEHRRAMSDVQALMGGSGLVSTYDCYQPASLSMKLNDKTLRWLARSVFLFAMLLAFKTQADSVNERKRDIGILDSLGWSKTGIAALIFYESVIQSSLGALAGAVVSLMIAPVLIHGMAGPGFTEPVAVPLGTIGLAVCLAVACGVVAGFFPAWSAARKRPVANLHSN